MTTTTKQVLRDALDELVKSLEDLIDNSGGVYGLHLNGDPAPWHSLTEGGQFETWLLALSDAQSILAKEPQP